MEGSHAKMMDIYQYYTSPSERSVDKCTADDWQKYYEKCPKNDSSVDYIKEDPSRFHIPLRDILFSNAPVDYKSQVKAKKSARDYISGRVRTGECVKWHNRGETTSTLSIICAKFIFLYLLCSV